MCSWQMLQFRATFQLWKTIALYVLNLVPALIHSFREGISGTGRVCMYEAQKQLISAGCEADLRKRGRGGEGQRQQQRVLWALVSLYLIL